MRERASERARDRVKALFSYFYPFYVSVNAGAYSLIIVVFLGYILI